MLMLLSAGMTESGTSVRGSISSRLTCSPRKSPEPAPGKVLMLPVMEELLCGGALQRAQDKRSVRPRPDPRSVRNQRLPGVRPSGSVHIGVTMNISAGEACFAGRVIQSVVPTVQRPVSTPGSLACSRFCTRVGPADVLLAGIRTYQPRPTPADQQNFPVAAAALTLDGSRTDRPYLVKPRPRPELRPNQGRPTAAWKRWAFDDGL